jgi:excinuclease UvrABC ATPase subunit|tara:strand:- start:149 stop:316 length:168 start_codon:yes stop_codon:yes gene_type:complete
MKKRLSSCTDCGDDSSILTQVSSGPDVILLCTDCYNLKYSKEIQKVISYDEKEKS